MKKNGTQSLTQETLAALAELEDILKPSKTPVHEVLSALAKELRRLGPHKRTPWIRLAEADQAMRGRLANLVGWVEDNLPGLREMAGPEFSRNGARDTVVP